MRLPVSGLGLLSAAAVLLLQGGCAGSSSHSLRIFYTLFMGSSQDGAQYIVVVYVDDQLAARFDPTTRRMLPQVAWLHNVREEDSHFWDTISWTANHTESTFKNELHVLSIYHNSSRGFHSWQNLISCQLSDEGHKEGKYQYGYDGETFISLDQKTLSWNAANVHAQETKRRWEAEPLITLTKNGYLENECIELLQKCIMYGKDSLQRKELPVVKVTRRIHYKNLETLVCQVYGFYPKEVNVTWRKDGEVWEQDTFQAGVLPNSDGTYHTWLSIKVDPKEKWDHYRCYVEHAGLLETLIVAWEEPANVGFVVGVTMAVVVSVVLIAAVIFYVRSIVEPNLGSFKHQCRSGFISAGMGDHQEIQGLQAESAKCVGATGRAISTTSQEFELRPVLQDQDQRQQDQDQRQQDQEQSLQLRRVEDFQRMRMKAGPLGPSWDSC